MWSTKPGLVNRINLELRMKIQEYQSNIPVRVVTLAKKELKIDVQLAVLSPNISGVIKPSSSEEGKFVIQINRYDNEPRRRFTIAHEIGHFLLHREKITGDGIADSVLYRSNLSDTIEREANLFAADLLMPQPKIIESIKDIDYKNGEGIPELAEKFNVSLAAIRARLGVYK